MPSRLIGARAPTDPLTLPHIVGLLAAIDAGDDTALLILADALEDEGVSDTDLLRTQEPHKQGDVGDEEFGWAGLYDMRTRNADIARSFDVPSRRYDHEMPDVYQRLKARGGRPRYDFIGHYYPTRSAAFIALAEALISSD